MSKYASSILLLTLAFAFFGGLGTAAPATYCAYQVLEPLRIGKPDSLAGKGSWVTLSTDFVWATRELPAVVGLSSFGPNFEFRGRLVSYGGPQTAPLFEMEFPDAIEKIFSSVTGGPKGSRWVGFLLRNGNWGVVDVANKSVINGEVAAGVREVTPDPTGRYIALNIFNSFFEFYDTKAGKFLWGLDHDVTSGGGRGAFDATGEFFITVHADGTGEILNVEERRNVATFRFSPSEVRQWPHVSVSPYSNRFSVSYVNGSSRPDRVDSSATVFELVPGAKTSNEVNVVHLNTFITRANKELPIPVAFNPSGGYFVGLADGRVREFSHDPLPADETYEGKTLIVERGSRSANSVEHLVVSSSGHKVAASYQDGSLAFWDLNDVTQNRRFPGYKRKAITQLMFNREETSLLVTLREGNIIPPNPRVRVIQLGRGGN